MLRQLFEQFYNQNIEVIATKIVGANKEIAYQRNIEGVYEEYLNQRTALRYLIKSKAMQSKEESEMLLDGHKVAACIVCAILKTRLIISCSIEDSEDKPYELRKSNRFNEQLAVLSGLSCLLLYMADDEEYLVPNSDKKDDFVLLLPDTKYEDRSTYLDSLVRGIYYSNLISNVNPLLLSDIFFLLEQFHRKSVELIDLKNAMKLNNNE